MNFLYIDCAPSTKNSQTSSRLARTKESPRCNSEDSANFGVLFILVSCICPVVLQSLSQTISWSDAANLPSQERRLFFACPSVHPINFESFWVDARDNWNPPALCHCHGNEELTVPWQKMPLPEDVSSLSASASSSRRRRRQRQADSSNLTCSWSCSRSLLIIATCRQCSPQIIPDWNILWGSPIRTLHMLKSLSEN